MEVIKISSLPSITFEHFAQEPSKAYLKTVSHSLEEIKTAGITDMALSVIFSNHHCPVCQKKIAAERVCEVTRNATQEKITSLVLKSGHEDTSISKLISPEHVVLSRKISRKRKKSPGTERQKASKASRTTSPSVSLQREDPSSISSSSSSSSSSVTNLPKPKDDIPFNLKKALQSFKKKMKKNCSELLERKQTELYQKPSHFIEKFWADEKMPIGDYILGIGEDEWFIRRINPLAGHYKKYKNTVHSG